MQKISIPQRIGKAQVNVANQFRSRAQVEFHTLTDVYGPGRRYDPTAGLQSLTTQTTLGSTGVSQIGSATITLSAGVFNGSPTLTWDQLLSLQNLVVIYLSAQGTRNMRTVFIGYISKIRYRIDTSDATNPTRSIVVTADDLLVAFNTNLVFNTYQMIPTNDGPQGDEVQLILNAVESVAADFGTVASTAIPFYAWLYYYLDKTTKKSVLSSLSPSQMLHTLTEGLVAGLFSPQVRIQTKTTSGLFKWIQLISLCAAPTPYFQNAAYSISPQSESILSIIQQAQNAPFLEFFGDVRSADQLQLIPPPESAADTGISFGPDNATYCVILRPTPFNTTSGAPGTAPNLFEQLYQTTVSLKDIITMDYGPDADEILNYYFVYPESYMQNPSFAAAINTFFPVVYDPVSIAKYGLRDLQIGILGYGTVLESSYGNQLGTTLYDWYAKNDTYLFGTITLHGNPDIRIGQTILIQELNLSFYVESVSHEFIAMTSFHTTLTVSRGEVRT